MTLADLLQPLLIRRVKSPAPGTPPAGASPNPEEDMGLTILVRVMAAGMAVILIVSIFTALERQALNAFWPVLGLATAIALVSSAVGGLLGFLFGIPISHQTGAPPATTISNPPGTQISPSNGAGGATSTPANKAAYSNNTNLEQISDWLTKIIVGVSLTQLPKLQQHFQELVEQISAGLNKYMGRPYSIPFTGSLLIFYAICGFLFVYLWAKIYLKAQLLLTERDIDNIINSVQAVVKQEVSSQVRTKGAKSDIDRLQQKIDQFNRQRTRIAIEEEKPEFKTVIDKAKPNPVSILEDAQKNRWGAQPIAGGLALEATFERSDKELSDSFYYITLTVRSLDPQSPLTGMVYFFLHDSYNAQMIQKAQATDNRASIRIGSYEAFTVGAYAEEKGVKLELDLNSLQEAPEDYKYQDKLSTIDELRQELDGLKQEVA